MVQELLGIPSSNISTSISNPTISSTPKNLRCPRCDSSNTKFCYYNNYNLTQPRHFCKTCRRYWTKGGALRNVPIGGGCRKNKATSITSYIAAKSSATKLKTLSSDLGNSGFIFGLEHELSSNPSLWASPQNTNYPLSFIRANKSHNTNIPPTSTSIYVKDERFEAKTPGFCSSFWRNNLHQTQENQGSPHQQYQSGFVFGENQSAGLQELYQRLRSTTKCYSDQAYDCVQESAVLSGNVAASSSSSILSASMVLDSAPSAGSEVSLWGNPVSWSDLSITRSALP